MSPSISTQLAPDRVFPAVTICPTEKKSGYQSYVDAYVDKAKKKELVKMISAMDHGDNASASQPRYTASEHSIIIAVMHAMANISLE